MTLVLVSMVLLASCSGNGEQAAETTGVPGEVTVREIEVTEVSSGNAGEGSESPYVVVTSSPGIIGGGITAPEVTDGATYLAIFRGRQTTGGYSVAVGSARRESQKVVVTLELRNPPEDALVAQVITYPYTVVALAEVGTDEDFVFEDTSGRRLDWRTVRNR